MTLIALIICFLLEIFWSSANEYRRYDWFGQYVGWLQARFGRFPWWNGDVGVVSVLLVPLLIAGFIQSLLADVWLGLFELVFGIAVLLYCLRFQALDRMVDEYCDAKEADDEVRAQSVAAKIISQPSSSDDVMNAVLIQSNDRLFSVLFWFFLLGPLGALLYRLSFWLSYESSTQEEYFVSSAHRLSGILEWIPARLLVVGYAVTGSFEDAVHAWREYTLVSDEKDLNGQEQTKDFTEVSNQILCQAGLGALRVSSSQVDQTLTEEDEEKYKSDCTLIRAAHSLVLRTVVAWGLVIALITLAGWAS